MFFSEPKNDSVDQKPLSTREWAKSCDYDSMLLFEKLFNIDITYLLKMDQLWEHRRKPTPLVLEKLEENEDLNCLPGSSRATTNGSFEDKPLEDQRLWTLKECYQRFSSCVNDLKARLVPENYLVWDKDDDAALDFVTAVSNLRSFCFGIERKSRFDVKSMAGNVIPAISTTNSIIGGIITLQLIHLLKKISQLDDKDQQEIDNECRKACKCVYLRKVGLNAPSLLSAYELDKPNPNCLVCTSREPSVEICCCLEDVTMFDFVEQILFKTLNFVCPDVQVEGTSTIIWSKDDADEYNEEEKQNFRKKTLNQYPLIRNKTRLKVYDLVSTQTMFIDLKDEKIDPQQNDGLFFKWTILSGEINNTTHDDQNSLDDDKVSDASDSIQAEALSAKGKNLDQNGSMDTRDDDSSDIFQLQDDECVMVGQESSPSVKRKFQEDGLPSKNKKLKT